MNLYEVKLVAGATFLVVAEDETQAARAAEKQWKAWKYRGDAVALSVILAGWGGRFPPKDGCRSDIPWLIDAEATLAAQETPHDRHL